MCFLTLENGKEEQKALADIQAYIESENKRLERDPSRCFDAREINIRMEYRYCPNMIVIDTPGMLHPPKVRTYRTVLFSDSVTLCYNALYLPFVSNLVCVTTSHFFILPWYSPPTLLLYFPQSPHLDSDHDHDTRVANSRLSSGLWLRHLERPKLLYFLKSGERIDLSLCHHLSLLILLSHFISPTLSLFLSLSLSHCLSLFESILIIIIAVFFLSPTNRCQDYIILCVEDTTDWKHATTRYEIHSCLSTDDSNNASRWF